jgi:hypothetical protein
LEITPPLTRHGTGSAGLWNTLLGYAFIPREQGKERAMRKWLAVAVLPLMAAVPAHAQMTGLAPADVAAVARTRALDLRILQQQGFERPLPLIGGMIAQRDVAPNAAVGIGMARIYGRKKRGDARITDQPSIGRKPAVTFVVKF